MPSACVVAHSTSSITYFCYYSGYLYYNFNTINEYQVSDLTHFPLQQMNCIAISEFIGTETVDIKRLYQSYIISEFIEAII